MIRRPNALIALSIGLLLALAGTVMSGLADRKGGGTKAKDKGGPKSAEPALPALNLLGQGQEVTGGAREPSGIAYHPKLKHLFVVGDEGSLVELDGSGKVVGRQAVPGNLEDVTFHAPTGFLLLLVENRGELIVYDPGGHKEVGRFRLDTTGLLGEPAKDPTHGFEGVFFREEPGATGGGLLYLVHQRHPAMVVVVSADLSRSGGTIGADAVKDRFKLHRMDLTAITYVPSLDRLLVLSDADDRILVMGTDGQIKAEIALPGVQQEGLCFDPQGTLWIADDRAGRVVRYPGALAAFTVGLKPGR
jgi:uncharacterized protein YjiK